MKKSMDHNIHSEWRQQTNSNQSRDDKKLFEQSIDIFEPDATLFMGAYVAATFEDIMEDIADSLVWIKNNVATTKISLSSSINQEEENKNKGNE
eukprot:15350248-Ditylum_brightwellii.AAC.1